MTGRRPVSPVGRHPGSRTFRHHSPPGGLHVLQPQAPQNVPGQHLLRTEGVHEAAWWWMLEYDEQRPKIPQDPRGDLTPAEVRQRYEESSTFALCAWRGSLWNLLISRAGSAVTRGPRSVQSSRRHGVIPAHRTPGS